MQAVQSETPDMLRQHRQLIDQPVYDCLSDGNGANTPLSEAAYRYTVQKKRR